MEVTHSGGVHGNEQAQELIGMTADELAAIRDSDDTQYQQVLKGMQWTDWLLRVQSKSQCGPWSSFLPPNLHGLFKCVRV